MTKRKIAWKRIILKIIMLAVVICLFIYIFGTGRGSVCKQIDIKITNSETAKLITVGDIRKIIDRSKIAGKGKPLTDDVIKQIYKLITSKSSVKNVLVYQTGDTVLHVELEQRMPVVRILTSSESYYLDIEGTVFPVSTRYAYDVPLVTGEMPKNSGFVRQLPAFADFISKDSFWNAQIQQIDVDENRNITFVISSDNHLIRFGQIHGYEKKLDNLLTFYRKVNPYYRTENDVPYTILDMRFNNRIVAIRDNSIK
jgi:cell division protein FtsQ